jgi:hypothetical protein
MKVILTLQRNIPICCRWETSGQMVRNMRKTELKCGLIERIEQLDLNDADRRIALETALRARRVAELLHGLVAGASTLAEVAIATPLRRGAAWLAGRAGWFASRRPRSS